MQSEDGHWFHDLKGNTDVKAQEIFDKKTYKYALSLQNQQSNDETKIKPAKLTNGDLPQIINGSNSDPIEKQPFSWCAMKEKIFKTAKDKLVTFEKEYGSTWEALMEVQLKRFQAKLPAQDENVEAATPNLQAQL